MFGQVWVVSRRFMPNREGFAKFSNVSEVFSKLGHDNEDFRRLGTLPKKTLL